MAPARLLATLGFAAAALAHAQQPAGGVQVLVHGVHAKEGGGVIYRYQVRNGSASTIDSVTIGVPRDGKTLPAVPWKFNPLVTDVPAEVPASQCKPFVAMVCEVAVYRFAQVREAASVVMRGSELHTPPASGFFAHPEFIQPGTDSSVAEIRVAARDATYLSAAAEVGLFDRQPRDENGQLLRYLEVPLTKSDTTAPTLQGTATVQRTGALLNVQVQLNATDDIDPLPEVALVSVSANQPLRPADVQAQLGADTRRLVLRAVKGRVYKLLYRVTDASENSSSLELEVQ